MRVTVVLPVVAALSGCATITAIPLEANGVKALPGAVQGFRYWLPRAYLQVMVLPVDPATSSGTTGAPRAVTVRPPTHSAPRGAPVAGAQGTDGAQGDQGSQGTQGKNNQAGSQGSSSQQASSTPGAASDTSFSAASAAYQAKIVYFPDLARPMAIRMSTGLFGTASMQLTLQDGWMLTNISANGDSSQNATVLTAAFQAIAGGMTGGATTALSAKGTGAKTPPGSAPPPLLAGTGVLAPGLYAFDYMPEQSRISSVCAIAYYGSQGVLSPTESGMKGACGPEEPRMPSGIKGIPAQ